MLSSPLGILLIVFQIVAATYTLTESSFLTSSSSSNIMAGTVYLRTNRFEVKLEGITFKTKEFDSLCKMDFLFPDGKVWVHPPIVGLDVMRHPRDPSILLLLLCFGVGCVILRFRAGEALPPSIHTFLADKRVRFVGFSIPEKKDLFPFEDLGLTESKVDVGYLAAKTLKDPKFKKWELAELARKVLGIKKMIGLTEASSFERHEQVKCAICQLFVTSVIAMGLVGANEKKELEDGNSKKKLDFSPRKYSFLKNLNSLHLLAEGWFKLPIGKKKNHKTTNVEGKESLHVHVGETGGIFGNNVLGNTKGDDDDDDPFQNYDFVANILSVNHGDDLPYAGSKEDSPRNDLAHANDDNGFDDIFKFSKEKDVISQNDFREASYKNKRPLKGILKCPSTGLQRWDSSLSRLDSSPLTPPSTPRDQTTPMGALKRANSKGCNVTFKCQPIAS